MKAMNGIIRYGFEPKPVYATWNDKFPAEKVCFENEAYLIHFDGIILNNDALKAQLGCASNQAILEKLYQEYGAELVFHAKGLYSLVIWDKQAQKVLITNDLLSKRSLFYCSVDKALYYGSSYHDLLDILAEENLCVSVNEAAVQDMLSRGFVAGSKTYLEEVCYLNAFESLIVDLKAGSAQLVTHSVKTADMPEGEDAAIDRFEELLSAAVSMQYRKNAEYGYTQCTTLSGGMDSRANLLTAVKLGFDKDIVCFNYAQSGSLDYSISQQIAADLGLDYVFYPMDAAVFLGRLSSAMAWNECMQSGIGATGARTMANLLDTSNFGLLNIGICGGELMGDLVHRNRGAESKNKFLRISKRICNKLREELTHPAPKAEDYCFDLQEYLCHLRASQNFAHMFIDKCECISPFMDEDVVMYVLQLNPGLMYNRQFYRKWMRRHIPNEYIITSSCAKIDSSLIYELISKLRYSIISKRNGVSQASMNPITHWFEVHPHHAENCTKEFMDGCSWLSQINGSETLLKLIRQGWNCPWIKRLYVLTALQALKDIYSRFYKLP